MPVPPRAATRPRQATPAAPCRGKPAPPDAGRAVTPPSPQEPVAQVLRRFRQVFNAVKTHFQHVERKAGIGGAQLWALSVIHTHPGIGVKELARAMDLHQTTTSNLVKALVTAELVAARKNGPDRRTVQLQALPAGQRVLRRAPGPFAGVLPEALARLDAPTLLRLEADLSTLIAELQTDEKAAGIPLAQM